MSNFLFVGTNTNIVPYLYGAINPTQLPNETLDPTAFVGTNKLTYPAMNTTSVRSQMRVKLVAQDTDEMGAVMGGAYSRYSIMSLDGLLSPVSFYPTPYAATFSITSYSRPQCPFCKGRGIYETTYISNTSFSAYTTKTPVSVDCPYCVPQIQKSSEYFRQATPGSKINPPYILTNDQDDQVDAEDTTQFIIDNTTIINKFTLNPIVMQEGEFSVSGNKQEKDLSGHCIEVVAAGLDAPTGGQSIRTYMSNTTANYTSTYNQRFMALRGPLMLHSWGYDTDGYPVPNESGEYKLDAKGSVIPNPAGGYVYKTQELDPFTGAYTPPKPSNKFKTGFAQIAHDWPVGPIDFRWDATAGVWTIGKEFKKVWVTIETDLSTTDPVRGVIYDDGPTTLPDGYRKLVFVKDTLGVSLAPRKTTLYCEYNGDDGFYHPVYNTSIVTSGNIQSAAAVDIYLDYSRDNEVHGNTYTTTYSNPLNFNSSNGLGIFTFIGGEWVLTAVR